MGFIKFKLVIVYSILLLLVQISFVSCETNLKELTVKSDFELNKKTNFLITRKKNDGKSGASGLFTETSVSLVVESIDNGRLKGSWLYGGTVLVGAESEMIGSEEQEIINIYEGLNFSIEIHEGKVSLLNYESIRRDLELLFLKVYRIDQESDESGMYQRISNMFKAKASTSESLLNSFFPEIPLFFSSINETYVNNQVSVLDSIQSPYQPSFIDIVSTINIEKIDNEYEILRRDSISQDVLNEQMKLYMNEMFGEQAKNIPFSQMPKFNYTASYVIWLNEDKEFLELEKSMFLSNGGNDMSNSLTITKRD